MSEILLKSKLKSVIFDLDGTLADTLEDLADSTNAALAEFGFAPQTVHQIQYSIGTGARELIRKSLPESSRSPEVIEKVLKRYIEIYGENYLVKTKAYPGLFDVIDTLYKNGINLGVVTNKPDYRAKEITQTLYGDRFKIICGMNTDFPAKPDPGLTLHVMEALGASRKNTVFVGDSDVDFKTAQNAGIACINVLWGFRTKTELEQAGASCFVSSPSELLEIAVNIQ